MTSPDLSGLEARIGHVFADRTLLKLALTHVSASGKRLDSYQRLEFLGDRVLGLVIADMLYANFPQAEEGELSRRLAELVRRESCAASAERWGVEPFLRLAPGEAGNDSLKRAVLGDVCEALIGAVFLDGGLPAATRVVRSAFEAQMMAPLRPLRDPKTVLQEWAQARGLKAPIYRERGRTGPDHAPAFTVAVIVEGLVEIEGQGGSKRLAEQAAASALLAREGVAEAKT